MVHQYEHLTVLSNDGENKPSKTQRKQAMHTLQKLGETLAKLNDQQLAELNLPEKLIEAIKDARRIHKSGAYRRQMQFIGKLIRTIDITLIQEKLHFWQHAALQQSTLLHQTERWRERILSDQTALTEFAKQFPTADITQIRLLIRNAHAEKAAEKPSKSYRRLFQVLQMAMKDAHSSN